MDVNHQIIQTWVSLLRHHLALLTRKQIGHHQHPTCFFLLLTETHASSFGVTVLLINSISNQSNIVTFMPALM
jgi:hypothetical protein